MTATIEAGGVTFAVRAPAAAALWLSLFDGEQEHRVAMARDGEGWRVHVPGVSEGARA